MKRSISEVTDAGAIQNAMAEYDRLGQEAFLSQYGYKQSRLYRLVGDRGQQYDGKAILGVAYGYQFPNETPLKSDEFSGGEQTVRRHLETLGFQVIRDTTVQVNDLNQADCSRTYRNPTWQRDELILALDVYVHFEGNPPGHSAPEIESLSKTLNQFHALIGTPHANTLRNVNGVYMKLMNFRRFDPTFVAQGKAGLSAGGKLEEEIWNTFLHDPERLNMVAQAIRQAIEQQSDVLQNAGRRDSEEGDSDDKYEAIEGRMLTRQHRAYERNRKLVERKKQQVQRRLGKLSCEACKFDFAESYGDRGVGFIECHHIRPVSELTGGGKTTPDDLVLLCANCHRMVHARRPWLSLAELINIRINHRDNPE